MRWTPRAPGQALEGRSFKVSPAGRRHRSGMVLVERQGTGARKHGRLARSDEHTPGVAVPGSESGHALQVRWRTKDSRFQAGQSLALQEVEAGSVDGREVEPDGAGIETQTQSSDESCRGAISNENEFRKQSFKRRAHVWNGIKDDRGTGCGVFEHQGS